MATVFCRRCGAEISITVTGPTSYNMASSAAQHRLCQNPEGAGDCPDAYAAADKAAYKLQIASPRR